MIRPAPAHLQADAAASAERYERLRAAMAESVLGPEGFCCSSAVACRGSIPPEDDFYEGQLSYVGRRFELSVGEMPMRILILGMDTGRPDRCVTQAERRQQVLARVAEPFTRRNPHMRGTTLALRVLLEPFVVDDEFVTTGDERIHLLETYAMANARLCSAIRGVSTQSRGTPTMTRNCLRHLRTTIDILRPQLIVLQGARIRQALEPLLDAKQVLATSLERVQVGEASLLMASLGHPSYPGPKGNWSWPSSPYFIEVVQPALQRARELMLSPN